jgi:hypothetical protein
MDVNKGNFLYIYKVYRALFVIQVAVLSKETMTKPAAKRPFYKERAIYLLTC